MPPSLLRLQLFSCDYMVHESCLFWRFPMPSLSHRSLLFWAIHVPSILLLDLILYITPYCTFSNILYVWETLVSRGPTIWMMSRTSFSISSIVHADICWTSWLNSINLISCSCVIMFPFLRSPIIVSWRWTSELIKKSMSWELRKWSFHIWW